MDIVKLVKTAYLSMSNLIDKAALVAEIERLRERFIAFHHRDGNDWPLDNYGKMRAYNEVLSFIDTLEVKEVDLLTPEEIKKICTIYDNLNQERNRGTILYNSDETFFNHVLMEYKVIAQKGE